MAVCCVFFDPSCSPPCQVFRLTETQVLGAELQHRLEERYCRRGTFITCPLYEKVERCLQQAHLVSAPARKRDRWRRPARSPERPATRPPRPRWVID